MSIGLPGERRLGRVFGQVFAVLSLCAADAGLSLVQSAETGPLAIARGKEPALAPDTVDWRLRGVGNALGFAGTAWGSSGKKTAGAGDRSAPRRGSVASRPPTGTDRNLANQATNPTSALIQFQIQNVFTPASHNASGYANNFVLQPVIPFHISDAAFFQNVLTRTTLPISVTANPDGPQGRVAGLSDTTLLVNPIRNQKLTDKIGLAWGPIGAAQIPTATRNRTGTGKLSLGGGAAVIAAAHDLFAAGDSLQFGTYFYNVWSVAGEGSRADVNKFFYAPIVTYHFANFFGQKGWYTRWTDELASFDWNADGGGVASIPVGAALGRVFSIGDQPVNVFLASDYYAAHRSGDPVWDIKLNVTLLFPE